MNILTVLHTNNELTYLFIYFNLIQRPKRQKSAKVNSVSQVQINNELDLEGAIKFESMKYTDSLFHSEIRCK